MVYPFFFRSAEDVSKLRKQAQMMKKIYEDKVQEMEISVTKGNDQNNILQNQINEYQLEVGKLKDVIKVFSSYPKMWDVSCRTFRFLHLRICFLIFTLN